MLMEAVRDTRTVAVVSAVVLSLGVGSTFRRRKSDHFKRGVILTDGRGVQRRSAFLRRAGSQRLMLAGVAIAPADETKHFKLIGTTGTGKSTAIRDLLSGAVARGDRVVFADADGAYTAHFHRRYRGDVLLNPFDPTSVKWDVFAEIRRDQDADQLAGALIPDCDDPSAREWRGYARTFLSAVLRRCHRSGPRNLRQLWWLLMVAPAGDLRSVVAGTPAQPFLDPDNARMFGSIRAVTGSSIAALQHIQAQRARPFSVRDWVSADASRGLLFMPYRANEIAALKSVIATWLRLAIFEAMSQPLDRDQRLWFVIDELDALGPIDGLKDALARLRKFGCRCVLGFQSLAQVSGTYGPGDAQTIIENCGNTLILRCSGSENGGTSQFASRLIGDREVVRPQMSRGSDRDSAFSARGGRRSRSISEHQVTEPAVLASQLEQLPDLCGYLKRASSARWLRVAFSPTNPHGRRAARRPIQPRSQS
jgi:type IV secretory pathway TraG/TraD family ATPase VirD4